MKRILILLTSLILLISCNGSVRPDGKGFTTVQFSEPTESICPYCNGSGIVYTYMGPQYCSNCGGTGKYTNISFKSKSIPTLKKNKKCPVGSGTFECIDEHNNGIISSTDECIHCGHMYYVHK